ncbi:DUF6777 domain-containing protein [Streptomyces sp. Da 82-17]|uniref:DUF6777 domain-containing protein n=1 Tax=Streptomyces sp. Da 82-17 TaxID=3377116 RepID=UPI0038D4188B
MRTTAAEPEEEVFLQPVAAEGPDPFTESTSKATETPPPVTRSPEPVPTGGQDDEQDGARTVSGGTPGLYGGTKDAASCDVEKQIDFLTANRDKERAFADTVGVAPDGVPRYLRGLTAVQLRADTRVTNHGFKDGRANAYQSVLQAGTAVMVDNRGVPRVRCSCGNPLTPPAALKSNAKQRGKPWPGYQPTKVVVVKPAPTVITNITIINITNNTWIERPTGHDGKDKVVPRPKPSPTSPSPTSPSPTSPSPTSPSPTSPSPTSPSPSPSESCPTDPAPDADVPPGCPAPPESSPAEPSPQEPSPEGPTESVPGESTPEQMPDQEQQDAPDQAVNG